MKKRKIEKDDEPTTNAVSGQPDLAPLYSVCDALKDNVVLGLMESNAILTAEKKELENNQKTVKVTSKGGETVFASCLVDRHGYYGKNTGGNKDFWLFSFVYSPQKKCHIEDLFEIEIHVGKIRLVCAPEDLAPRGKMCIWRQMDGVFMLGFMRNKGNAIMLRFKIRSRSANDYLAVGQSMTLHEFFKRLSSRKNAYVDLRQIVFCNAGMLENLLDATNNKQRYDSLYYKPIGGKYNDVFKTLWNITRASSSNSSNGLHAEVCRKIFMIRNSIVEMGYDYDKLESSMHDELVQCLSNLVKDWEGDDESFLKAARQSLEKHVLPIPGAFNFTTPPTRS
jgi:hypothetical protein